MDVSDNVYKLNPNIVSYCGADYIYVWIGILNDINDYISVYDETHREPRTLQLQRRLAIMQEIFMN